IGLGTEGSLKPVTGIASLTPSTVSGLRPGQSQTFSVVYSPSDANMGTTVNWSVSDDTVLSLSSSTVTVIKPGTSTVTAALDIDGTKKKSVTVNIGNTVTVNVKVHDWIWSDNAAVFAWAGIGESGNWIELTKNANDLEHVSITFAYDKTKLLLVRCPAGTTEPNWSVTSGDGAGRIYNQTEDIALTDATDYDTTDPDIWKSYGINTVTLTVTVDYWVFNDNAAVFAWAWDADQNGAWYPVTKSNDTTAFITIPQASVGFNMARCVAGTTQPDWSVTSGDGAGRIYNKTENVMITSGVTSYTTTWVAYP
ncbi:MAG: hypothetical protein J6W76_06450, partial [Spirochaetales bacterium]|nr:hypothetical protein [Spirochaetales bacterium]